MYTASTTNFTLIFERGQEGNFCGYVEEMPNLIQVQGNTLQQVRIALFIQVAQLFSDIPSHTDVRFTTKVRLKLTTAQQA